MVASAKIHTDDSLLSRLDRALFSLEKLLALVSGAAVFSLMLLAVWSVAGRWLNDQPLRGYIDWIEQAMPLIAFMGISYTQREGGHIRMDMVVGTLRGRALWAAELVTTLGILLLMVLLVWGSWAHFARSFDFAAPLWSRDSTMDISLPLWPAKLLAPVAFSVLVGRLVLQCWSYGRALVTGDPAPVAVPLHQDVSEQAAAEAAQLTGHDT